MTTTETMSPTQNTDADLVAQSLRGSREAFGQIVARYQTLICSLAYSATGSLSQSEDLSQETFLTAWQQLSKLQEPAKLRSWLCAIAKNLTRRNYRDAVHEPTHHAEQLETAHESPAIEPHPLQQTITREEENILWRSLEQIPETYREPLILYYREHESIERVAEKLELSEEAVRQRLTRGRKLLHEQVLSFVEGALEKTNPGKAFTYGVLSALPLAATSAKAATITTALAKGGTAAKSVFTWSLLGSLGGLIGGALVSLKAQADDTKSPREKKFLQQIILLRVLLIFLCVVGIFPLKKAEYSTTPLQQDILRAITLFAVASIGTVLFEYSSQKQRQIQIEDGTWVADEWTKPRRETAPADVNGSAKSVLKAARYMAFGLTMFVIVGLQVFKTTHPGYFIAGFGWISVCLLMLFRGWQNNPRYLTPKAGWQLGLPLVFAFMTLIPFDLKQNALDKMHYPTDVIFTFNTAVITAYVILVAWRIWWHKKHPALR